MGKKLIICTFALCVLASMFIWSKQLFINKFNNTEINKYINYSYIFDGIKCGNYYISENNKFNLCFGKAIEVVNLDIDALIEKENTKLIALDKLEDKNIYILYCKDLPLYRLLNGSKFNLQICVANEAVKIGYPAIFDSF